MSDCSPGRGGPSLILGEVLSSRQLKAGASDKNKVPPCMYHVAGVSRRQTLEQQEQQLGLDETRDTMEEVVLTFLAETVSE